MSRIVVRSTVAVLAALTLLVPSSPAAAASATVTTVAFTFVAPVVTVPVGGTLDLRNSDLVPHNLVSSPPGRFASPTIGRGQTAGVAGVSSLPAGSYAFFCDIHPFMRGSLTVSATGGGGLPALPLSPGSLPVVGVTPTPTSLTVFEGAVYTASLLAGAVSKQAILPSGLLGPALPYATGFTNPLGVAFAPDGTLFVADSHASATPGRTTAGRVWAMPRGGGPAATVGQVVIDELPNGRHNTNGLAVHGDRLYITNGNSTDDGVGGGQPEQPLSGTLLSVPLTARGLTPAAPGDLRVVASGMRNDYDVAFRPGTSEAWLTMNGPDAQDPYGQDLLLAADTAAATTTDFGFPGCVYALPPAAVVAQNRNPAVTDVCDGTQTLPKALLGLHTSADGLAFGPPGSVWAGNLFVAQFGNFSGSQVVGHRILRLAVDAAGNVGRVQELLIGGLPLDVAFGPAGLYIADFALGVLFIPNVLAGLLPTCADQQSGSSETGILTGPIHQTVEPLTGPLQPTVHTVNCMLLARLGL